jgi:hypothetical protein
MRDEAGAGDALNQRTRRRDRVQLGAQCVRAQPANAVEANVRADAIVFNSALSAYARNRPRLRKPARKLPRDMQSWGVPPTMDTTS